MSDEQNEGGLHQEELIQNENESLHSIKWNIELKELKQYPHRVCRDLTFPPGIELKLTVSLKSSKGTKPKLHAVSKNPKRIQEVMIKTLNYGIDVFPMILTRRNPRGDRNMPNLYHKKEMSLLLSVHIVYKPSFHFQGLETHGNKNDLRNNKLVASPKSAGWACFDLKVHCQDEVYFCHKSVLASKSEVVERMPQTEEKLEIKGLQPAVVKAMIKFVYSEQLDNVDDLLEDLLKAADVYKIKALKRACESMLSKVVTKGNALKWLMLAKMYGATHLHRVALSIVKKHIDSLVSTLEFSETMRKFPDLFLPLDSSV